MGSTLVDAFTGVDRGTTWTLTGKQRLTFPAPHPQGLAFTPEHIFLSAVEVIERPRTQPACSRSDCGTAGKGVGHLFVLDLAGHLQRDILLGEGHRHHPGGIDFDGHQVWVPVAEYRPRSRGSVYGVDAISLEAIKQFQVRDHIGNIVMNRRRNRLVGTTWALDGSLSGTGVGRQHRSLGQSLPPPVLPGRSVRRGRGDDVCRRDQPAPPLTAGGACATYELGGIALIDITSRRSCTRSRSSSGPPRAASRPVTRSR